MSFYHFTCQWRTFLYFFYLGARFCGIDPTTRNYPFVPKKNFLWKTQHQGKKKRRGHETTQEFPPVFVLSDSITMLWPHTPKKEMLFREMPCFVSAFQTCLEQKRAIFSWPIIATSSLKKVNVFPLSLSVEQLRMSRMQVETIPWEVLLSDRRRRCLFLFLFYFLGLRRVLSVGLTTWVG